ncbi:MAG: hypothetical protein NWT08_11325 [Akkermansiaceae bacterium]|jgi:hypothetical protein|nr:hypothetical protein [Akkermansiaceae bacterium]MDP4646132.1 hypothetical protein [Akkermansiaceae bacterium]MDP4720931.1 hypothetical protein [Akkermansiaceae bacterium]MDP4780710.1 hypothetical protein [Akkermansiaceae bacterium]MDP4845656.1 hypothetical protein [Akkermansiaceae bacterium]
MEFLDKWERKLGWMSFPGLFRYYALFHVMVFLLQFLNPAIGLALDFDLEKILNGEVWRVVTFLFSTSGLSGLGGLSVLFLYFMVIIAFMVSDGLEGAWGVFRTSMFFYVGIAGLLVANVLFSLIFWVTFGIPLSIPITGLIFYQSAFFAFATLFPKVELLLFFVLPVQVRWFAIFSAAMLVAAVLKMPFVIALVAICFIAFGSVNYLLWAGIPALRGKARVVSSAKRKRNFNKTKSSPESAFHCCSTCSKTEVSDPELEFRMAEDGKEYCLEHLPD